MGLNHVKSNGLHFVPEYQVSGYPWITGSIFPSGKYWMRIDFPRVTQNFTVVNLNGGYIHPSGSVDSSKELVVFFGDTNVADTAQPSQITNNHFITLPEDKNAFIFNVKTGHVFVGCHDTSSVGGFQITAELTGIPAGEMLKLTGSGIDETF